MSRGWWDGGVCPRSGGGEVAVGETGTAVLPPPSAWSQTAVTGQAKQGLSVWTKWLRCSPQQGQPLFPSY